MGMYCIQLVDLSPAVSQLCISICIHCPLDSGLILPVWWYFWCSEMTDNILSFSKPAMLAGCLPSCIKGKLAPSVSVHIQGFRYYVLSRNDTLSDQWAKIRVTNWDLNGDFERFGLICFTSSFKVYNADCGWSTFVFIVRIRVIGYSLGWYHKHRWP